MSTQLNKNLTAILDEKINKITPANITSGVTIFNVEGTAPVLFTSTTDMEVSDLPNGTFAIVCGEEYEGTYLRDNDTWVKQSRADEAVNRVLDIVLNGGGTPEETMDLLNQVLDTTDEYEGLGGTEKEIENILKQVITGEESSNV